MTLGQALREIRSAAGLTQAKAASKMGVSRPALSLWENDRHSPGGADMPRIAKALGTTASAIYYLVENRRAG